MWEVTEDIVSLIGNFGALDLNEANVVSSRFKTDLAQPVRTEDVFSRLLSRARSDFLYGSYQGRYSRLTE